MAKESSLKKQLSALVGGKKANVFYKGMNTDTDEHLIGNDQYTDGLNVRINNKDGDLGALQNLQSNKAAGIIQLTGWRFRPTTQNWWVDGGAVNPNAITNIRFAFTDAATANYQFNDGSSNQNYYDVDFSSGTNWSPAPDTTNSNADKVLGHVYDQMISDPNFTSVMQVMIGTRSDVSPLPKGNSQELWFFPITQGVDVQNISFITTFSNSTTDSVNDGVTFTSFVGETKIKLKPISLTSFSDYIAAVCYYTANLQAVVKFTTDEDGLFFGVTPVVMGDFGLTETSSIQAQKIEENEHYNRLYWTDGVNPIKTVNLNATGDYYSTFTSADDFNLFAKSPLLPLEIETVQDSGSINCGSWSYCYRLVTSDGKLSVTSPITNPTPLFKSSKGSEYSQAVGGTVAESSGKSVTLKVSNPSTIYSRIQLIGIQYLDEIGSAAFFLLKDEVISESLIRITHSGNENTTVITAEEVLSKKNTWDIAQDLAVKDNRLLAANLKNTVGNLITDNTTFRVKTYKHDDASNFASFMTSPASGAYVADSEYHSTSLYQADVYKKTHTDETFFRYAEGKTSNTIPMFGASTPGYHSGGDVNGVYVPFKLKECDLDKIDYYHNFTNADGNNTGYARAPFFGPIARNGEDGYYNNYKNPVFANKYVGYMRDEIYRFGIQFYDKDGNQTFSYPIGDIRFPSAGDKYRYLGTTVGDYSVTEGGAGTPTEYVLCDESGRGFILYPEFRVRLSSAVRDKISGFSIVRAERNDTDKRVVCAGLLNQTLEMNNSSVNGSLKNRYANEKLNLFTQVTGDSSFGPNASYSEIYTLDSPDVLFGLHSYTHSANDFIKIECKFNCHYIADADLPDGGGSNVLKSNAGNKTDVRGVSGDIDHHYAIHTDNESVVTLTDTNARDDNRRNSYYTRYYCQEGNIPIHDYDEKGHWTKAIHYGQNVGPFEVVNSALLDNKTKDYVNACRHYTDSSDTISYLHTSAALIQADGQKVNMHSNRTLMLAQNDGSYFTMSSASVALNTPLVEGENYAACKPYGKIIRQITVNSGQYGGNSLTNFETTRWISTGASLHGDDITSDEMILPVFGGDTYLNMFSLSKCFRPSFPSDTTALWTEGVVFPVESSINTDMRSGVYFGKNLPQLDKEDEFVLNTAYGAENNLKSFPAKQSAIPIVNEYKNVIAISNIKVAGQTQDAFSKFDANENFEVDANHGGVNNIINFRNNIYAIQEKAVSILSINSRALIQSEDGSAIAIQSALGAGNVIERNDYISTKYGSRHRMNALATDLGLYWYDNDNNTICEVDAKSPKMVVDLSTVKSCSNALTPLRKIRLSDNPLLLSTYNSGGINISYNPFFNEVMFSISYYDSGALNYLNICYDEAIGAFTSKRGYNTLINTAHKEYLYSVGHKHGTAVPTDSALRYTVYSHDSTATTYNEFYGETLLAPYVEFVNNEEVGSLKVFDKVSISFDGSPGTGIFSTFVYNTNVDDAATLDLTATDIDKVVVGKQIVPIHKTSGRFKGNYVKIKMTEAANTANAINVFSATTHYRKNII